MTRFREKSVHISRKVRKETRQVRKEIVTLRPLRRTFAAFALAFAKRFGEAR